MRGWLLGGAALGVAAAIGGARVGAEAELPGPLASGLDVVVPRGSVATTGAALFHQGVIASPRLFAVIAEVTSFEGMLRAGQFHLAAHASLMEVLAVLRSGQAVEHLLTIPEGLTSAQISRLIIAAPGLVGDLLVPAEGSVLPQSYAFLLGSSRASVVQRAQEAARAALHETWVNRAKGIPLASATQLLVLASMVERETAVAAERPLVARVFLNRLQSGMRLQSDPTASYGMIGGLGELGRTLTRSDLELSSPYNTYVNTGLPVGAVCSPGLASLQAVAHPAISSALYFVAAGDGGHRFSASLAEHDRNVQALRRWEAR